MSLKFGKKHIAKCGPFQVHWTPCEGCSIFCGNVFVKQINGKAWEAKAEKYLRDVANQISKDLADA